MKCWICGANADSGEHRAKKSDLAMIFKNISQKKPLYAKSVPDGNEKIEKVGSLKSDKLKWDSRLCHDCNTNKTQPYDLAWEMLSAYLQNNQSSLRKSKKLKLHSAFPGSVKKSMLNVHLYFLKVFGCIISEHDVPIPIQPFSSCMLEKKAHPEVYMGIGFSEKVRKKNIITLTPIETVKNMNVVHFASWQYWVRDVFVDIMYSIDKKYMKVVREFWHPDNTQKVFSLSELKSNQRAMKEVWG